MSVNKAFLCGFAPEFADALQEKLRGEGFGVECADRLEPASRPARRADVLFFHLSGGHAGERKFQVLLEEIQVLRITRPTLPIICSSDGKDLDRIVLAVKAGASDYHAWADPKDPVPEKITRFLVDFAGRPDPAQMEEKNGFHGILGRSPEMHRVFDLIGKVSGTSSTILITGESGTGKELVCRAIHKLSNRANKSLIPINCGAIPEELLESELFGHEKGAFTGATTAREGRFQMADGGTLFLDEIGEMSPKLQVKLLRVLQEREFVRVGGGKTYRIDVRVVTATNQDLELAVSAKVFREDLFYRLNVIPVHLPPLRERKDDIPILIDMFIMKFREKGLTQLETVHPSALAALQAYAWPGNVRELENLFERMAILAEAPELRVEDLPDRFKAQSPAAPAARRGPNVELPEEGIDMKSYIDDIEKRLIEKALEKSKGVKNRAAQLLGLNRTTLVEKMKKKNLDGGKMG
ncbi:MAG: sigma-54 dependent transcriptional regulator [bacterium]